MINVEDSNIVSVLVSTVNDLVEQVDKLKKRVKYLENELRDLPRGGYTSL